MVQSIRMVVQVLFFVFISVRAMQHQILGGGPRGVGPIDALCPFGGLEALYKFISKNEFINRLYYSDFVLMIGVIILAFFFGRYFCGWICIIGSMQEWFEKIGMKIFKKRYIVPEIIEKPLRYLKYVILVLVLFLTWKTATLVIRPYDPYAAYAHLFAGLSSAWKEFSVGLVVLMVSLISSLFYSRTFCKYLCPLGAVLGIANKLGIYKIERDNTTCTHCKICDKSCPMNIKIEPAKTNKASECINCVQCVTNCPTKKNTLQSKILKFNLSPVALFLGGLVIYFGTVGTAIVSGMWKTQPSSLQESVLSDGKLNPDNIKGFMSLREISTTFNVDLKSLYDKLNLDINQIPPDTKAKDIRLFTQKSGRDFEAEEIRAIVREMLNIVPAKPIVTNTQNRSQDSASTPQQSVKQDTGKQQKAAVSEKPKTENSAITQNNTEKKQSTASNAAPKTKQAAAPTTSTDTAKTQEQKPVQPVSPEANLPDPSTIKGSMTLKQLSETYGIPLSELFSGLNLPKDQLSDTLQLRDIKNVVSGFEVQAIRDFISKKIKK